MTARRRATVRLLESCNNLCVFCAQDGLPRSGPRNVEALLAATRQTHDELTFTGGEPTLYDGLEGAITSARALGFRRVGIQTNGARLVDGAVVASLARAGLTDVHLSLHGSDSAVHDYHTGRPGSFGELLSAMRLVRDNGLDLVVTTVLTRSNFRVLAGIPSLLAARGVAAWFISVPAFAGRAAANRDRIAPRLGLAIPFALHALTAAREEKVPSFIVGAPLCLLGPLATESLVVEEPGAFAAACDDCAVRSSCPGLDPEYLARFAGDELAPRQAPVQVSAEQPELRAMFVGPGELARPAATTPAPSPRAKTSLPLLGKVKPAIAEAPAGAERRSGEALKAILPALFDNDPKR